MATSTLLQKLDGETTFGASTSNRSQVETFIAGETLVVGDWVEFDASQTGADRLLYVIQADGVATKGSPAAFGVLKESVEPDGALTSGSRVRVVVAGYAENANVAAATVAGSALIGPIGTDGRAEIEVPGTTTGRVIGVALEDDSVVTNVADVWVVKSF